MGGIKITKELCDLIKDSHSKCYTFLLSLEKMMMMRKNTLVDFVVAEDFENIQVLCENLWLDERSACEEYERVGHDWHYARKERKV